MTELLLARWQFGITTTYHFLFVPLTLGLSILVAIMETMYVRTGSQLYKKMTQFWGKLFLVNFALGVVTGIVQEFHFGMNWSEYARFMGDIFGAPLAMEALTAFFLESTFLGLWLFGWERLPKRLHAATIWIVALAGNLSAFWILVANSFMQSPVGYVLQNGRAEMTDFAALITNPYVAFQFSHTFFSGLTTAGVFVMAISSYHLLKGSYREYFLPAFRMGVVCTLLGAALVAGTGHLQAQNVARVQPMKLAAVEALWETNSSAPLALYASIDEEKRLNTSELSVPGALSFMVHNSFTGEVKGINNLQAEYTSKFGPGNYIPQVTPLFWSFHIMFMTGGWMLLIAALGVLLLLTGRLESQKWFLRAALWTLPVPYIANSTGWFVTEMGRQPWIVYGLQRVEQAVSPGVPAASILISLIGFTLVYGVLALSAVYLARKIILQGPEAGQSHQPKATKEAALWN